MPTKPDPDLLRSLEDVLDLERTALVDGDLDRLNHMVPEKEKLIGAINELMFLKAPSWCGCRKSSSETKRF